MSSKNYQTAAFASLCFLLGCSSETGLGIADLPPGPGSAPAASQPGGQPTQLIPPPPGLPPSVPNPPPPQRPKPAVCQVDLRRTISPRATPEEYLRMLQGRWVLCGEQGLAGEQQGGLDISNDRYAVLEPDPSGALILRQGPGFQGSVGCARVNDNGQDIMECSFRPDLGQPAMLSSFILGPTPLMLVLIRPHIGFAGLHHYVAEQATPRIEGLFSK
jgi:hypothetical protein